MRRLWTMTVALTLVMGSAEARTYEFRFRRNGVSLLVEIDGGFCRVDRKRVELLSSTPDKVCRIPIPCQVVPIPGSTSQFTLTDANGAVVVPGSCSRR